MVNGGLTERQEEILQEFNNDSRIVGEQTAEFLRLVYPSYLVNRDDIEAVSKALHSTIFY